MTKLFKLLSLFFLFVSCKAQTQHKDQMEFGFRGKVKAVIKKVYSNPAINGESIEPNANNPINTYTYFFNQNGNIDSAKTEYTFPSGESNGYKTIYKFENLRKSEWVAINETGEKLLIGKIKWASDKEYTESVYDASDNAKYEVTTFLNDSFRIIKTKIKAFDGLGNTTQDDIQEFDLDKQLNAVSYKTTHNASGQTEVTDYEYLKMADFLNPKELIMTKREKGTKTLIRLTYIYY